MTHLSELVKEAQENPEQFDPPGFNQPPGTYVDDAEEEFRKAGFAVDEEEGQDPIPEGAIALRAHELREEDEREFNRKFN